MKNYLLLFLAINIASCTEILNEPDIRDEIVCLFAPADNVELLNSDIRFSWCEIEYATNYRIQIVQPDFANAVQIVLDTIVEDNEFSKELESGNYQWRVRAQNSAYETLYTTNTFTLVENTNFAQSTVNLQTPIANLITNEVNQNLSWESVPDAVDYRLQIWTPDINGTIVLDENIETNTQDYIFLEGEFVWQIRAQTNTQNTLYSARNIVIDSTPPNIPILLTPIDTFTASAGNISFTWERESIAGSVEVDSLYIYSDEGLLNLVDKAEVSNNIYTINLIATNYYWLMKSFDEAGNESENSTIFNLIVE